MHKLKKCAFSVKHFYTFLSVAREGGLLSPEKLHNWQETLREFQVVMQPSERNDLRSLDIETLSQRYIELVSKERVSITPWLIHTRKMLLKNAIGNFIAYAINPLKYCDSMQKTSSSLETDPFDIGAAEPPRVHRSPVASARAV